jgi:hypothetical protein
MRVECEVEEITLENDEGHDVDSVRVTCGRCDDSADAYGTSGRSIRRCLVALRDGCLRGESNFYVADGSDDD